MADEMDRVQAINETWQKLCLEEHRRKHPGGKLITPPFGKGGPGGICIDCGEEIPEARRRAVPDCDRCIDCQALHERRHM